VSLVNVYSRKGNGWIIYEENLKLCKRAGESSKKGHMDEEITMMYKWIIYEIEGLRTDHLVT